MAYVIIDKTKKVNYTVRPDGYWVKGDVILPNGDDNFAHTYETLEDCIEFIVNEINTNAWRRNNYTISDFSISEIKEMDKYQMFDMVQSYLDDKYNES